MSTRTQLLASTLGLLALSMVACSAKSNPLTGENHRPAGALFQPGIMMQTADGLQQGAIAPGRLTVDPSTLSATWEIFPTRSLQDNDAVFALSLEQFFTPSNLRVTGVRRTAQGLQLSYEVRHPFPDSSISNRADLGFSAMLLFGFDVPNAGGYTWFTGTSDLITDPRWILDADGYFQPKSLVDTTGLTANAFPYKVLVRDDVDRNRYRQKTGEMVGSVSGQGNFGTPWGWHFQDSDEWAGFGVLHQGQFAKNSILLSNAMLSSGPFSVNTVLLAKYADPKSGTPGVLHRLPVPIADAAADDVVTKFGYRMPHGALDVPRAWFRGPSEGWSPNIESTSTLRFHVIDWDARATETTESSLKLEPNAIKVAQGESGIPLLALCIPGVLGGRSTVVNLPNVPVDDDRDYGGDSARDSGYDGDPLFFQIDVTKPAGSGQVNGDFLAWLRVTDVEGNNQSSYLTPLHPDLTPATGDFPTPVTFHPFIVRLGDPCPPPTGVGWLTTFGSPMTNDAGPAAVAVDSAGNLFVAGTFYYDTDFGAGERTTVGGEDVFLLRFTPTGTLVWDRTWGSTDDERFSDLVIDSQDRLWLVGHNRKALDLGGGPLPVTGTQAIFLARFDTDGTHQFSASYSGSSFNYGLEMDLGPSDAITLVGYSGGSVNFGGGPLSTAGSEDIVAATFNSNGTHRWSGIFGGSGWDTGMGTAFDNTGNVYITGGFSGSANFGTLSATSNGGKDIFLARLAAADGEVEWLRTYGNSDYDEGRAVVVDGAGRVTIVAEHIGILDLGGGPLPGSGTNFETCLAQYSSAGAHQWSTNFPAPDGIALQYGGLTVNNAGDLVLAGYSRRPVSLGGPVIPITGNTDTIILARFAADGTWQWDGWVGGAGVARPTRIEWTGPNTLHHIGYIRGSNFDADPSCNRVLQSADIFFPDHYVSRITGDGTW